MRAWVLGGPEELSMVEKQVPKPGPAEVLVRVDAIAVCATDIEIMKHGLPAMVEGELPFNKNFTIGHEYMGTIVRLGPSVDEFHIETGSRSRYMPGAAAALAAARVCIRRALTTVFRRKDIVRTASRPTAVLPNIRSTMSTRWFISPTRCRMRRRH